MYGPESRGDKAVIDDFYTGEFNEAQAFCGRNPAPAETVARLKAAGKTVVLATNPIFPATATENRIRWAGLEPEDFLLYTTYENSHYSKPNPKYFEEILRETGRKPEECVMVGNDASEDTAAGALGIPVFLLTDCLINRQGADLSAYPQGGFPELKEYLARL